VVRVVSAQIPENGDVTKGGSAGTGTRDANGYATIYLEPGRWILGEVGSGRSQACTFFLIETGTGGGERWW
jgi:hypothetical protein